ncbi:aldose 1-epimerase family protein [Xylocopilactobacillus apicola]|uniref:Galactose mutarotase n=1 Tax=Xylocopilactobacillus apicola TaxID=2932184 RepID=A0AAU9DT62_9LACO|nr:aldose 1-epimerase family protein [Xylocopilactobacillus apicola]BDR59299.1 galactose mutarotase [Xylocopilactobacillus apicola]
MFTIENENFRATINQTGAELQSVQNKKQDNYEYIWNDQSGKFWHRHSPILFPAAGRSNNDQYELNGKIYPMMQHGFARDYPWKVTNQTTEQITFELHENADSLKIYPFKFTLAVTYQLNDQGLNVSTKVTNNTEQEMPFALGFHPAFNTFTRSDGSFDDYSLTLEPVNGNIKFFAPGTAPFINGQIEDLKESDGNQIPLTHELLDDGFVLIANTEIDKSTLSTPNHERSVTIECGNFPYLNVWSQEHANAPFICVEPFAGLPDIESDQPTDWYHKKGNSIVKPNETTELHFQIDFK